MQKIKPHFDYSFIARTCMIYLNIESYNKGE